MREGLLTDLVPIRGKLVEKISGFGSLLIMAYACDLCGKGKLFGKDQTHRHGGMWALRGPSSSKHWRPNLRTVRIEVNGKMKRLRLCVSCLRKKVKQTVENK